MENEFLAGRLGRAFSFLLATLVVFRPFSMLTFEMIFAKMGAV